MNDLYEDLGVKAKASQAEIKKAYRDMSKVLHPDAGGNKDEFAVIANAYGVLSDKSRRARYDKTGIETDVSTARQQAGNTIQAIFNSILQDHGVENLSTCDIVSAIREKIDQASDKLQQQNKDAVGKKKALKDILKRVKHKDRNNLFSTVITHQINEQDKKIKGIRQQKEVFMIARKLLKDYGFEFDKAAGGFGSTTSTNMWIRVGG